MNVCRLWFIFKALWHIYSILYLSFSWPYSHTLEKNSHWLMPSAAIPLYPLCSHISLTCQRHPSVTHTQSRTAHGEHVTSRAQHTSPPCSANSFSLVKQLSAINQHLLFKGLECWDSQLYKCVCWLWWAKASHLAVLFKTPIDGRPLCQDEDISLSMRCKLCHNATVGFKRTLKGRMVLLKVASHITSHLCEETDMKLLWLCKILYHLVSCGHHIWLWVSAYKKVSFVVRILSVIHLPLFL